MKKISVAIICFFLSQYVQAQFRYDNKLYKTIFWEDLCKTLPQQTDYVLLDVRSPGEFADTSSFEGFNMGRLRGAINADIRTLPDSIGKLTAFKYKTIYVYCSHSQRSRRVSKMLSEKGFLKIININGGMTMFNLLKNKNIPCMMSLYQSSNRFKILSPREICSTVSGNKYVFLLDVRNDSSFKGISTTEANNVYGRLKGSVNIPYSNLANSLSQIPADKKIIVIDDYGNESVKAAKLLLDKGYRDISILFNGLDEWAYTDIADLPCKNDLIDRDRAYKLISAEEFSKMKMDDGLIIDIRTDSEFRNIAKNDWRNMGNIENAINIPASLVEKKITQFEPYKNKTVIVYGFSSSPEVFSSAKLLTDKGFKNVFVLVGGIFSMRWKAANIKNHEYLNDFVTNVPPDNY
jgi:rhodanese-related sulfurtransferase